MKTATATRHILDKLEAQHPDADTEQCRRALGVVSEEARRLSRVLASLLTLARADAGSMFAQERQQVVLLALVKLGRMDEARRLAKPYLARYPHGPFSERVRRALATGKVER